MVILPLQIDDSSQIGWTVWFDRDSRMASLIEADNEFMLAKNTLLRYKSDRWVSQITLLSSTALRLGQESVCLQLTDQSIELCGS